MDAVRDSLDRAGRHGFTLFRLDLAEAWFDLAWLQDYLEEFGHDSVPLLWEGRPFPAHDTLRILEAEPDRRIQRECRTGEILLREDVLLAAVTVVHDNSRQETIVGGGRVRSRRLPPLLRRV
jgi:hypothetical protein